jgi:hypothetical protein
VGQGYVWGDAAITRHFLQVAIAHAAKIYKDVLMNGEKGSDSSLQASGGASALWPGDSLAIGHAQAHILVLWVACWLVWMQLWRWFPPGAEGGLSPMAFGATAMLWSACSGLLLVRLLEPSEADCRAVLLPAWYPLYSRVCVALLCLLTGLLAWSWVVGSLMGLVGALLGGCVVSVAWRRPARVLLLDEGWWLVGQRQVYVPFARVLMYTWQTPTFVVFDLGGSWPEGVMLPSEEAAAFVRKALLEQGLEPDVSREPFVPSTSLAPLPVSGRVRGVLGWVGVLAWGGLWAWAWSQGRVSLSWSLVGVCVLGWLCVVLVVQVPPSWLALLVMARGTSQDMAHVVRDRGSRLFVWCVVAAMVCVVASCGWRLVSLLLIVAGDHLEVVALGSLALELCLCLVAMWVLADATGIVRGWVVEGETKWVRRLGWWEREELTRQA